MKISGFHLWCTISLASLAACVDACAYGSPPGTTSSASSSKNKKPDAAPPALGDPGDGTDPSDPGSPGDPGNPGDPGSPGNDAGSSGSDSPAGPSCIAAVSSGGDGHHNGGQDCISCHQSVSGANWTIAGTLYSAASGGNAVSGATIEIVDANNTRIQLSTCDNGNFYTDQQVAFPVTVRSSQCPSNKAMSSPAQNGSCNTSGCHASGNRIHL